MVTPEFLRNTVLVLSTVVLLFATHSTGAAKEESNAQQEIAALKEQVAALQKRLEELEKKQAASEQKPQPEAVQEPSVEDLVNPKVPESSGGVEEGVTVGSQAFNPDIAVVGEFVASALDKSPILGIERHDTINRHLELAFSQRVSPAARAVVKFAYEGPHQHAHEFGVPEEEEHEHEGADGGMELEEGYLQFDRLIPRMQIRLGRERVPFLAYNLLDGHELPFVNRPLSAARMVGGHGLVEDGVRFSYLLPTKSYANFDAAVYNGRNETAFNGNASGDPLLFFRLNGFRDWAAGKKESSWCLSYLHGPHDETGDQSSDLFGAEFHFQSLPTQFDRTLFRAGFLRGKVEGEPARQGYHVHLAKRWDRYKLNEIGLLFDRSESIDPNVDDPIKSLSLYYSWAETERIRPQIEYVHNFLDGRDDTGTLFFRLTYVMGTHPPHD